MNYNYIKCLTLLFTCLTINMYAQNIQTIISKTKANPEWQFSNLQFEATTGNGVLVAIDDATTFQEFKGMGVSFDRSAMANFISMSDTERDKVLRGLFDQGKEDGIKLDWIRYPFGTSDFTGTEWYTYNDLPLGDTMKKAVLKTSKNQISISDLPSGFYLLRLENKTYRLIKE